MNNSAAGLIARDEEVVARNYQEVPTENILTVEGNTIPNAAEVLKMWVMMCTPSVIVLRAERKKGMVDPKHKHDDHDTVSLLVKGKMKLHIGDETFEAGPGMTWRHRPGVYHWSETLEDSEVIEIKTGPVKTW
jgi:mannose-6-phosphate isomerase-like protein (cupin superfamily)